MKLALRALLLAFLLMLPMATTSFAFSVDDMQARTYTDSANGKSLPYRLFVPANYDPSKSYPLVLFLHGAGQRGNDNRVQVGNSVDLAFLQPEIQAKHPCFFVAPQCPVGHQWVDSPWGYGSYSTTKIPLSENLALALSIVRQLQTEFHIDAGRLYVTGLSMGGYGTWDLIERYPKMFAAAIPICGGADPAKAADLKGMAIWAFHCANDPVVPVRGSREMIRALWATGQTPNYTEYATGGHDAWDWAYNTRGLADWLFTFYRDTTAPTKAQTTK